MVEQSSPEEGQAGMPVNKGEGVRKLSIFTDYVKLNRVFIPFLAGLLNKVYVSF